ncbi:hypothetical protein E4U17_006487 [Claviceps sp. LM77 group G4]|nr:hypothetical protein E4U17_006487 [Claviceps sp. LM77 group G4]KAG6054945.1 hypothetical protein E4U33_008006 [Claviceps sp. LM78 group G4]KAG6069527.1 hypothetical protein E4U16_007641 [Claviceps sp. LM84 group G4]
MSERPGQTRPHLPVGDAGKEANVKDNSLDKAAFANVDKFTETDSSPKNAENAPKLIERLQPRTSGDETMEASSSAESTASQIAYQRLWIFLMARKMRRLMSVYALPSLTEEECADFFPLKCTDEQWAHLVAAFPMEDISEIILRQMGHAMVNSRDTGTGP